MLVHDGDDVCPICLCEMEGGFTRPENCQHRFDLDCLLEWARLRLSCPSCRSNFAAIYSYVMVEGKPILERVRKMETPTDLEPFEEATALDFTVCEICSGGAHEELLLICDRCDKGFHTYCLTPPLDSVPTSEQWFCPRCERTRMNQPSTSTGSAPSARTMRLVQRTALAERVRRILARNRQIDECDVYCSDSESEENERDNEEQDQESMSEDDVTNFLRDDARVLDDLEEEMSCVGGLLPSIKRRTKKQISKKKNTKKKSPTKRRTIRKRRKTKRKTAKTQRSRMEVNKGPLDAFVFRRSDIRDPIARLSLFGANMEPVEDEDTSVTENSRRFDRPLPRRRADYQPLSTNKTTETEKPPLDECDLLGSIIPEQMKTLAPGRLFAVRGGRFDTTDDFEKYKARKTDQLTSELKERLGIPVNKAPENLSKNVVLNTKSEDKLMLSLASNNKHVSASSLMRTSATGYHAKENHNVVTTSRLQSSSFGGPTSRSRDSDRSESCSYAQEQRHHYRHKHGDTEGNGDPSRIKTTKDSPNTKSSRSVHSKKHRHDHANGVTGGTLDNAVKFWMPDVQSQPTANEGSSQNNASLRDDHRQSSADRLLTIERHAKDGIKRYKKTLTVSEYKDVMRAVVRECYKKGVLDGEVIRGKVRKYVHAVRNGEPLPVRHEPKLVTGNTDVEC